tara:strand:- start:3352 stop:3570 length:219 start_codon:yes stop_codon:yes gene_type:complete
MENNSPGHSIDYDDICLFVGQLYLESAKKHQDLNLHYRSVLGKLNQQSSELIEENKKLRDEIENVRKESTKS